MRWTGAGSGEGAMGLEEVGGEGRRRISGKVRGKLQARNIRGSGVLL